MREPNCNMLTLITDAYDAFYIFSNTCEHLQVQEKYLASGKSKL